MTRQQEIECIHMHDIKPQLPRAMQPKSWLLILADENKEIHLYDCRYDLTKAYQRIISKQPTHYIVQILPFPDEDDARDFAAKVREVRELLKHFAVRCEEEFKTSINHREPALAPLAAPNNL